MNRFKRSRRHPRAELACPPLRWRAVAGRVSRASAGAVLAAGGAVAAFSGANGAEKRWLILSGVVLAAASVICVLRLTHLLNAARTPVTFKVANGELVVTRPFLFWRRRWTVTAANVRAVTVSPTVTDVTANAPTGRLSIRRRFRLPIRAADHRPMGELNRVADELRSVLNV